MSAVKDRFTGSHPKPFGFSQDRLVESHPEPAESPPEPAEGGISVVICCHNSSEIIGKTLKHLSLQKTDADFQIQIILVDNASTDQTAAVAKDEWKRLGSDQMGRFTFQVLNEPQPGLSFARFHGARNATYPYIIFCDDDNFLAPDYCRVAFQIMQNDPTIGACGGEGIPVFKETVPPWFKDLDITYAWGPQNPSDGYVKSYSLYGAGLVIRRSIVFQLIDHGYQPVLRDRSGRELSSGGDEELTIWCKILKYQLYYTARLRFKHMIKSGRLTRAYVFNLYKAIGVTLAKQVPLQVILFNQEKSCRARWEFQVFKWYILGVRNVLRRRNNLRRRLDFHTNLWRIKTLLSDRKDYLQKLNYLTEFKKTVKFAEHCK